MYSLIRKLLFLLEAETAHELTLDLLGAAERLGLMGLFRPNLHSDPVSLMGLKFNHRVGLSAGLDKNGDYFNALGQLGFAFVEIGTITPKPQPGNPRPRMFRLADYEAIINRMGFNNKGVDYLVERVKKRRFSGVLGINIGKNKTTPEIDALKDYQLTMTAVYPCADYIAINISSPNTPGLRNWQLGDNLKRLLAGLKETQEHLAELYKTYKPIVVKIAPDLDESAIAAISKTFLEYRIDGVIATNTTLDHSSVSQSPHFGEAGGLSGAPLADKSTAVIQQLRSHLGNLPIMGVGGIVKGSDALAKIRAGADLVQLYSGLIYRGPSLIKEAHQSITEAS